MHNETVAKYTIGYVITRCKEFKRSSLKNYYTSREMDHFKLNLKIGKCFDSAEMKKIFCSDSSDHDKIIIIRFLNQKSNIQFLLFYYHHAPHETRVKNFESQQYYFIKMIHNYRTIHKYISSTILWIIYFKKLILIYSTTYLILHI